MLPSRILRTSVFYNFARNCLLDFYASLLSRKYPLALRSCPFLRNSLHEKLTKALRSCLSILKLAVARTYRQADRQTDRQTDRLTDSHTHRQTYIGDDRNRSFLGVPSHLLGVTI